MTPARSPGTTDRIVNTPASALPLIATRYHPDAGGTEVLIYTADRDDLVRGDK